MCILLRLLDIILVDKTYQYILTLMANADKELYFIMSFDWKCSHEFRLQNFHFITTNH